MNSLLLLQIKFSPLQAALLFGAILGFFIGLIPLILGIVKKRTKIGIYGLIGAIIGNAVLGIFLSIPVVIVSLYFILKKQPSEAIPESKISDDDSEII